MRSRVAVCGVVEVARMQENQQIVFLSMAATPSTASGISSSLSEHLIDWFHITMALTVLQQQAKVTGRTAAVWPRGGEQLET